MTDTEAAARQWLAEKIHLQAVDFDRIKAYVYNAKSIEHCDIFCVLIGSRVGSAQHIAVPRNGDNPFSLGELGE